MQSKLDLWAKHPDISTASILEVTEFLLQAGFTEVNIELSEPELPDLEKEDE